MYEIWLALNIVWEVALGIWPLLLVATVTWCGLVWAAWRRPGTRWRAGAPRAVVAGLLVAASALLLIPGWTDSSLSEMGYWVDWSNLGALAAGFGAVAAAFVWPLAAMHRRSPLSPP